MLKLARNTLADVFELFSSEGKIQWKYIRELTTVQEREGLKAASQFSSTHVQFQRHKMNVKLAVPTLSASVASAIDFMREDMKHPAFIDSEATTSFI